MSTKLKHIKNWPELARQANWSATALAKLCGVSRETLRQYFIKHMCKAPGAWLTFKRQDKAIELLRAGASVKEVATLVGYKQQTNFTRKFNKFWGACPSMSANESNPVEKLAN